MTLTRKTALIFIATLILMMAFLLVVGNIAILNRFRSAENTMAHQDLQHSLSLFLETGERLAALNHDWAHDSETVEFTKTRNPALVKERLTTTSFHNLQISLIAVTDNQGKYLLKKAVETTNPSRPLRITDSEWRQLAATLRTAPFANTLGAEGMVFFAQRPMFFAVHNITHSSSEQSSGQLIMGSFACCDSTAHITSGHDMRLAIFPYQQPNLPPDVQNARKHLSATHPDFILPLSKSKIAGYTQINDFLGKPLLILRIIQPRDIFHEGLRSLRVTFVFVSLISLFLIAISIGLLRASVLRPLNETIHRISQIGKTLDTEERLPETRADELGDLSRAFNNALAALDSVRAELAENNRRLRIFIRHTPAAVAMFDTEMRYLMISRRWAGVFKLADNNIIGRGHFDIFPHAEDVWTDILARCLAGEHQTGEGPLIIQPDAEPEWIEWEMLPWQKAPGQVGGVILFMDVVTEQKRARETLRQSEEKFRSLFENLASAAARNQILLDQNGAPVDFLVLETNKAFEKLLGAPRAQLIGKKASAIFPGISRLDTNWRTIAGNIALNGGTLKTEFRSPLLNKWLAISVYSAEKGFFVTILDDIDERKNAETAIRESETRYRSLFENLIDAFAHLRLVSDPDGAPVDFEIIEVNQAFEKLTCVPRESAVGNNITEILPLGISQLDWLDALANVAASARPFRMELHSPTFDKWLSISVYSPRIDSVVVIIGDVTQRRQTQENLKNAMRDISTKNLELESFAYTVSHDLKAPLITIEGFAGILEEDYSAQLDAQATSSIKHIRGAATRMSGMIDSLLDYSRIGRVREQQLEIPLATLVDSAAKLFHKEIAARDIKIIVDPNPHTLFGESLRMTQVFENLIGNAVKFIGDDNANPAIEIGADRIENRTTYFVRDNGVGVTPDYHEKIFNIFQRHPSSKRIEGNGVGLAIVKRIIETHGGRVWIESNPPHPGSTFYFTLPEKPV